MRICLPQRFGALHLLLTAALSVAPACFGAAGSAYVDVADVPPNYAAHPSYVYDGANVYFIDGRWYRQHRGRWVYYRSEPVELYRYRTHGHVVVAPPARGREHRHVETYRAPPRRADPRYRAPAVREAHRDRGPSRDAHRNRTPARDDHHRHGRD